MKKILIWGSVLLLSLVPNRESNAHLGDQIFPIWEIPSADLPNLHDGTLEDWEAVLPGTSMDYHDFVNLIPDHTDPSDLAFRVFLAWHSASQQILVAIERLDNVLVSEADMMSIRIDGDHSGGRYAYWGDEFSEEESKRLNHSQAQSYRIWAYSPEGVHLIHSGAASHWVIGPPWADAGGFQGGEAPSYAAIEIAVTPWDDLNWESPEVSRRSLLEGGRIIGIEIGVHDIDEPIKDGSAPVQNSYSLGSGVHLPGGSGIWADEFVDAELIPCQVGDCGTLPGMSVIRSDPWGRIKASFR